MCKSVSRGSGKYIFRHGYKNCFVFSVTSDCARNCAAFLCPFRGDSMLSNLLVIIYITYTVNAILSYLLMLIIVDQFVDKKSCAKNSLFTFTPCLLHHFLPVHRSNNNNTLPVPRVKTNTGARAFHFCLFGTASRCLSIQPFRLLPSRNICQHISLTWPFPHRHWCAQWPVDVTVKFNKYAT